MADDSASPVAPPSSGRPMVITVFNQKGGVGKTTTSVNLAVCMAALGRKVALVDLDSQSNATTSVGITPPVPTGAYHLITGRAPPAETLRTTVYDNLLLVGGTDELAWADIELALQPDCQSALSQALAKLPAGLDMVVIDCPPAPGIVSVNALVAADMVVMPVVPSPHALDGLHKAWWNVNRVRTRFNRDLHTINILMTMTEEDELNKRLTEDIIAEFGGRVMPVPVPRDTVVIEAAARDLPVVTMAPQSPPARAYLRLAELLLNRARRVGGLDADTAAGDTLPEVDRDGGADRLAQWKAEIAEIQSEQVRAPEPGAPPLPGWTQGADSPGSLAGPGWGWKVGVSLLLLALGAVLGYGVATLGRVFPPG